MATRKRDALGDFWLGMKGQFPSLEEVLTHPQSERKLIPLQDPTNAYNKRYHSVSYWQNGEKHRIKLDPAFRDYMREYAHATQYVTDKGTPWLTREQEGGAGITQVQLDAYYQALCKGENREIVMINWTNTHKQEPGHSAISVGSLSLVDGASETDEIPVYDYTPEITGSYYGSTTPLLGTKHWREYWEDSKVKKVGTSNPLSHAAGLTLRDSTAPISAFVGSSMMALMAYVHTAKEKGVSERKINAIAKKGISAILATTVIGASSAASGLLSTSHGTLLMKEESEGAGLLATLITPAQRDILEHSLYGIYQTYYGKYNILTNNCADFTQKMLDDIDLKIGKVVETAMQQERPKSFAQRVKKRFTISDHIKPNRHDLAISNGKPQIGIIELPRNPEGEQKKLDRMPPKRAAKIKKQLEAEPDTERLYVIPVHGLGQSTVMVKTPSLDKKFHQEPIDTFRDVMKHALTIHKDDKGRCHFALQPHIQVNEPEQVCGFDR